ncbi:hypothetical protein D3C75_906690 [compost metagenome]
MSTKVCFVGIAYCLPPMLNPARAVSGKIAFQLSIRLSIGSTRLPSTSGSRSAPGQTTLMSARLLAAARVRSFVLYCAEGTPSCLMIIFGCSCSNFAIRALYTSLSTLGDVQGCIIFRVTVSSVFPFPLALSVVLLLPQAAVNRASMPAIPSKAAFFVFFIVTIINPLSHKF